MRLGKLQIRMLLSVGTDAAMINPSATTRRLCELGLMKSHGQNGSFAAITPNGLRALADMADAGIVDLFCMPDRKPKQKG